MNIPTAWLQLAHKRTRLIVALSGIIFSTVIIFMQLGIRDALFESAVHLHNSLEGDAFLISPRSTSLIAMESFSERRLLQVLSFNEVELVSPIYVGYVQWKNPDTKNYWRNIFVIGIDLRYQAFKAVGIKENWQKLKIKYTTLFDQNSRREFGNITEDFQKGKTIITEVGNSGNNQKIEVVGLFELGTSFGSDGNLLMSYPNFLRIFQNRSSRFIDIGLIKFQPDIDRQSLLKKLKKYLPKDVKILSKQEFINFEKNYWATSTAIGFIFNLGVFLGLVVGIVVVYQILYTNVAEHLAEYVTLKAMGYHNRYLLWLVFQQALIIAVLGYIPGFLLGMIQYYFTQKYTLLPIEMTPTRAIFVFGLTLLMSLIAGATAINKLQYADPADIF